MPHTQRDPITGAITFKDPANTIINQTTGQTAQSLTPSGPVGSTAIQPPPIVEPEISPFNITPTRGVEVGGLDETLTTSSVFDFRDQLAQQAQSALALSQPSETELGLNEDIFRAQEALNQVIEDERGLIDFSEDRQVDISTIRGEQAQTRREFGLRKQDAVNTLSAFVDQKSLLREDRTQQLQATRENFSLLQQLAQATLPDVLQTQVNEQTGEVTATVRDPNTGEITTVNAGFVEPSHSFEAPKLFTNALGQVKVWSIDESGNIVVEDLDRTVKAKTGAAGGDFKANQFEAATFAQRMVDANSFFETTSESAETLVDRAIPDSRKSDSRRQFNQAENNFINAQLRRESGAAIADDEYTRARATYIPVKRDDAVTLANKARARAVVIQGLTNEAGGAFDLLGSQVGVAPTSGATSGTTSSGLKYTVTQ